MMAESQPIDAPQDVLRRWDLSVIKESIKRIWAAMHGHEENRGPTDYPEWDDERRILIDIIRKQTRGAGGNNYQEGGSSLLKWILGVLATLTVAVIIGGVTVYGRFTSLETRVAEWQKSTDRRLDLLERKP